jgi:hypothetical protein
MRLPATGRLTDREGQPPLSPSNQKDTNGGGLGTVVTVPRCVARCVKAAASACCGLLLITALSAVGTGGAPIQLRPQIIVPSRPESYWLDKVARWRTAVAQHDAGSLDEAVFEISHWPISDLQGMFVELKKLDRGSRLSDVNRILKRGALLHTDIALLAPANWQPLETTGSKGIFVNDGLTVGTENGKQWEFARLLLDSVTPQPAGDEMIQQWYLATTAIMQSALKWSPAKYHLKRALEIFPSDAGILFFCGVLHEAFAAPRAQNVQPPPGSRFDMGTNEAELALARVFFQRAVKTDDRFAEAHLHLGRVTGLLGDHDAAVAELRQADALLQDPQLQYYAAMFLGHEHEMLRNFDAARAQFERAGKLSPKAQSPLLALGYLARRTGDSAGALAAVERALTLRADTDPWWEYEVAHVRNADTLLGRMREAFGGLAR